jgi:hypothetical protein
MTPSKKEKRGEIMDTGSMMLNEQSCNHSGRTKKGSMHVFWRSEELPGRKGDCRLWTMMCVSFEHHFLLEGRADPFDICLFLISNPLPALVKLCYLKNINISIPFPLYSKLHIFDERRILNLQSQLGNLSQSTRRRFEMNDHVLLSFVQWL